MNFSLRSLFIAVATVSVLIAFLVTMEKNYRWYNHEVAEFDLDSTHKIRVWTEGYTHRQKLRKLLFRVWINGSPFDYPDVIVFRSHGNTDNVDVAFADDNRFFCIHCPTNTNLLVLGDLKYDEFAGTNLLKFPAGSIPRHSFSIPWQQIFDKIQKQNPDIVIEFPKQRGSQSQDAG